MSYCRTSQPDSDVYVIGSLHSLECLGTDASDLEQPDHEIHTSNDWANVDGKLVQLDTTHQFAGIWCTNSRKELIEHLLKHRERGDKVPDDVFIRLLEEINEVGDTY